VQLFDASYSKLLFGEGLTGRWRSANPPRVRLFVGWAVVIVALILVAKYCPWLVRLIILFWRGVTGSDYGV